MSISVIRYSERPELWRHTEQITREVWPEYNLHGDGHDWARLFDDFSDFQFLLYDDNADEILAEGHTAPCAWDGTADGLGPGLDHMLAAAYRAHEAGRPASALCALAAEIRPRFQGRGLADAILEAMSELARKAGFPHLIAPVRPSLKDRYPITPIEQYATWTRDDGQPFDPWLRVHVRRGGQIVKPAPRSLRIMGTVSDWETWTGMRFPADGRYTFPAGLAPVDIDHPPDLGTYWEPNIWVVHATPAHDHSKTLPAEGDPCKPGT